MTAPDENDRPDENEQTAANVGALAAASQDGDPGADPLGPLNAVTEDDED